MAANQHLKAYSRKIYQSFKLGLLIVNVNRRLAILVSSVVVVIRQCLIRSHYFIVNN